jgi:prepilin-type N-terminal cleavage/methylation domain-containing protein
MRHRSRHGFSLIEMLIYIAVLSVIFIVVVNTVLSFTGSYRKFTAERLLDRSATDALERLTRDIRGATTIDVLNSTFGNATDTLTLISTSGSISTTTKFYISSNNLRVNINGTYFGPLTVSNVSVTTFTLKKLSSTNSTAIKIDLTVQATNGALVINKNYHSTVVIK